MGIVDQHTSLKEDEDFELISGHKIESIPETYDVSPSITWIFHPLRACSRCESRAQVSEFPSLMVHFYV